MAESSGTEARRAPQILVIDDSEDERYILAAILSYAGYEVHESRNGEEGLALAESLQPDLVIVDMNMPGLSGADVISQLKANPHTGDLKIMVHSIYLDVWQKKVDQLGVHCCLAKPAAPSQVREAVAKVIGTPPAG